MHFNAELLSSTTELLQHTTSTTTDAAATTASPAAAKQHSFQHSISFFTEEALHISLAPSIDTSGSHSLTQVAHPAHHPHAMSTILSIETGEAHSRSHSSSNSTVSMPSVRICAALPETSVLSSPPLVEDEKELEDDARQPHDDATAATTKESTSATEQVSKTIRAPSPIDAPAMEPNLVYWLRGLPYQAVRADVEAFLQSIDYRRLDIGVLDSGECSGNAFVELKGSVNQVELEELHNTFIPISAHADMPLEERPKPRFVEVMPSNPAKRTEQLDLDRTHIRGPTGRPRKAANSAAKAETKQGQPSSQPPQPQQQQPPQQQHQQQPQMHYQQQHQQQQQQQHLPPPPPFPSQSQTSMPGMVPMQPSPFYSPMAMPPASAGMAMTQQPFYYMPGMPMAAAPAGASSPFFAAPGALPPGTMMAPAHTSGMMPFQPMMVPAGYAPMAYPQPFGCMMAPASAAPMQQPQAMSYFVPAPMMPSGVQPMQMMMQTPYGATPCMFPPS